LDLPGYFADRIKAGKITLFKPTLEGARSKRLRAASDRKEARE